MGNIRERSFKDIWTAPDDPLLGTVRDATWGDLPTCSGCDARAGCDRCPGLAYHEAGDVLGPSAVHCEHAFARLESPKVSTTS
jgi:radical SAM protein with 4Fe4S-binding SPASM domain